MARAADSPLASSVLVTRIRRPARPLTRPLARSLARSLARGAVVASLSAVLAGGAACAAAPGARPAAGDGSANVAAIAGAERVVERWPDRRGDPVRVWVAPGPRVRRWDPAFRAAVLGAFDDWSRSGIPVRFALSDSAAAEVRVFWTDRLGDWKSAEATRLVSTRTGWVRAGRVTLGLRASDGQQQTAAALGAIARHEVGHLLGLRHSADPASIMAAWVTAGAITDADRARARALYRLPPGPLGGRGAPRAVAAVPR